MTRDHRNARETQAANRRVTGSLLAARELFPRMAHDLSGERRPLRCLALWLGLRLCGCGKRKARHPGRLAPCLRSRVVLAFEHSGSAKEAAQPGAAWHGVAEVRTRRLPSAGSAWPAVPGAAGLWLRAVPTKARHNPPCLRRGWVCAAAEVMALSLPWAHGPWAKTPCRLVRWLGLRPQ